MAKKRKTLPQNFNELLESGDLDALKEVYQTCQLDAYGGYAKSTALHFFGIPEELVRWLVLQGANINAPNDYQRTPLHEQAGYWKSDVRLFLELGAELEAQDYCKETPLHHGAERFRANTVATLLEYGANYNALNQMKQTPLGKMLAVCRNADIRDATKTAKLLLMAGATIDDEMKQSVKRIGEEFEFYKENFSKELLKETEEGLLELYALFDVAPIPPRKKHDGVSPITVTATKWQEQYQELWDSLVPATGYAKTVQGEVIRITGRVTHEILDNGGMNWDKDFKVMGNVLGEYLSLGNPVEQELIFNIIKNFGKNSTKDALYLVSQAAVQWVLANTKPIPMKKPNYRR